jgi:hypothetical protein
MSYDAVPEPDAWKGPLLDVSAGVLVRVQKTNAGLDGITVP